MTPHLHLSGAPVVISILLAIMVGTAQAQLSATTGSLLVTARDITDAAIPEADVTVTHVERNWALTLRTDTSGRALFSTLQPGEYEVSVFREQFTSQKAKVEILLGHNARADFRLEPAAVKSTVTVCATPESAIDAATVPLHHHVSSKQIEALPINQRKALDFALLDSSVQLDTLRVHAVANTSGFNVMGQRPRSNSLQLDGSDVNDETTGGVRNTVPMEAVQEFQVLIAGYQAEFGRSSGGVINVISKSGGNHVHGSAIGFLRHRSLDATNAFSAIQDPPYTRTQYGGSLSGPLRKDRTFFFAAFEQLRRQESGFSRIALSPDTFVLSPAQQKVKASDPTHPSILQAERGLAIARTGVDPVTGQPPAYRIRPLASLGGVYPVSQRLGTYSLRLDHQISQAHTVTARANYAHDYLSSLEAQNNDQISGLLSSGRTASLSISDPTVVLGVTSLLGPRAVNEVRGAWAKRDFRMLPNSFETPVNISGVAFVGREPILPHTRFEYHGHLQEIFTASLGPHLLKTGADWMYTPVEITYERETNGNFTFGPQSVAGFPSAPQLTALQAYGLGLPANYVQQFGASSANVNKTAVGAFLQDSWRARPNLTIELGLRYDVEHVPERPPATPALRSLYDRLAIRRTPPIDTNNLQPRAGFSYQAAGDKVLVRGSYGLFYDRLPLLAAYLPYVGDGHQMTRSILTGAAAVEVFRSAEQKLSAPMASSPTGINVFSRSWQLGRAQQGNLTVGLSLSRQMFFEAGYVFVKGTHLGRSRDINYPDIAAASAYLATNGGSAGLLALNYFRPYSEVSEVMALEGSASSLFHGLRVNPRGRIGPSLTLHGSYTFSKAIDDSEEILPHSRAQDMRDFRAERGLALYDQRHRFVFASVFEPQPAGNSTVAQAFSGWSIAPIIEVGSGRPVNLLLGFDNNLDQYPGSDRPDAVPAWTPGAVSTQYGWFASPPAGRSGNLGRNAVVGPGYASVSCRVQRHVALGEDLQAEIVAEGFNLLNRVNVRAVNPNYARAGEPLSAFDPRQVQIGIKLRF